MKLWQFDLFSWFKVQQEGVSPVAAVGGTFKWARLLLAGVGWRGGVIATESGQLVRLEISRVLRQLQESRTTERCCICDRRRRLTCVGGVFFISSNPTGWNGLCACVVFGAERRWLVRLRGETQGLLERLQPAVSPAFVRSVFHLFTSPFLITFFFPPSSFLSTCC